MSCSRACQWLIAFHGRELDPPLIVKESKSLVVVLKCCLAAIEVEQVEEEYETRKKR